MNISNDTIIGIFIYGTLRNDCLPLSKYAISFNKNAITYKATLKAAKLYFDSIYPFIVMDKSDSVVSGLFVIPNNICDKLKEINNIEQEGILYKCIIVDIVTEIGVYKAYTYCREYCSKSILIKTGNWLTCNKIELVIEYLRKNENITNSNLLDHLIQKTNGDITLIKSFIKWNIK
jgi:gamma-glutamylcyclotransferase (GGCT)/AIG2-like uncharacterized protein YtfP